jgi:hypothetical protein
MSDTKGELREKSLRREEYYSSEYFDVPQLCSFAQQINFINSLRPASILEVGIGNGFVSTFLKMAGYDVVTADINLALNPDVCSDLSSLRSKIDRKIFDLVVCCEVLEHMPLSDFSANVDHLASLGNRVFITLPTCRRTFGFGGLLRLPKTKPRLVDFSFSLPSNQPFSDGPHFWEVGSEKDSENSSLISVLKEKFQRVRSGRFALNPYHIFYICESGHS